MCDCVFSVAGERHSVPPGPHRRHHGTGEEVPGGEPLPGGPDRGQGQGPSGQVSGWVGHRMCSQPVQARVSKMREEVWLQITAVCSSLLVYSYRRGWGWFA